MNTLLQWLANITLSSSLVIAGILLLRRPVARWLGAEAAYRLWLLVPLHFVAATLLPAAVISRVALTPVTLHALVSSGPVAPAPDPSSALLVAAWCAVSTLLLLGLWRDIATARSLVRRATDSRVPDFPGRVLVSAQLKSPLIAGLFPSALLLPADFQARYTDEELRLVLAHETWHLRRRDNLAIALARIGQALFWFNPLVHYAVRAFRVDQELSCDALVLREAGPGERKAYGRALVKTAATTEPVAVASTWHSHKQLKERAMMLQKHRRTTRRTLSGLVLLATLSVGAGVLSVNAFAGGSGKLERGPVPVKRTQPAYPTSALKQHTQGKVVMQFTINAQGKVEDVKVVESEPAGVFDKAAVSAIKQWQFKPAISHGQPVPVQTRQTIRFQLGDKSQ